MEGWREDPELGGTTAGSRGPRQSTVGIAEMNTGASTVGIAEVNTGAAQGGDLQRTRGTKKGSWTRRHQADGAQSHDDLTRAVMESTLTNYIQISLFKSKQNNYLSLPSLFAFKTFLNP